MRVSGHEVMRQVARKHGFLPSEFTTRCARKHIAWPRQEAMYEIYIRCPHLSPRAIAQIVGLKDHTTVRHGVRRHCERNGLPVPGFGSPDKRGWGALCVAYGEAMRRAA